MQTHADAVLIGTARRVTKPLHPGVDRHPLGADSGKDAAHPALRIARADRGIAPLDPAARILVEAIAEEVTARRVHEASTAARGVVPSIEGQYHHAGPRTPDFDDAGGTPLETATCSTPAIETSEGERVGGEFAGWACSVGG